jgi:phage shock protein PspC (stress-responsive transcriptional regulator)
VSENRRPSLRRRVDERLIAGVMGGIADWLNAPVYFLRVVLYFGLIIWPWLVAVYAGAALLLPARGHDRPGWDNVLVFARVAAIVAVPFVVGGWDIGDDSSFSRSPELWVPVTAFWVTGLAVFFTRSYPRGPSEEEARATVLGAAPTFLAAAALALGIWLAPDVRWERGVALVPLVAGAFLLIGIRSGNWRGRIAPAVVATFAAAAIAAADVRLDGGIGDRAWVASAQASPPRAQSVAVGDLTLDLHKLPPGNRTVHVRASVGIGTLTIYLPRNARISLDVKVGRGRLDLHAGHVKDGLDLRVRRARGLVGGARVPGKDFHGTPIHLDATVGSGELSVWRGRP